MVTNYRPISLLSIFDKILERLMYKRLVKYFEKSATIFDQQFDIIFVIRPGEPTAWRAGT